MLNCKNIYFCSRNALNDTCFGTKLPYTSVSFIFTGHTNEYNVKTDLESYEWLRYVPECFEAIQRLLCAVHLPKCENGTVSKIPYKVCHNAHKDCSVLKRWGTDKQKKGEIILKWPFFSIAV